tara:strand:- start:593 stop:874 length:282 start_codon:yes stop_codon:yes gene_type:complete
MTEEDIMQEIPEGMEGMDPRSIPAPMRVNMLINELLQMVDHMSNIRGLIDETMKELMEAQVGHVHDENCNHDHDEVKADDDCCGDPDCESKEE